MFQNNIVNYKINLDAETKREYKSNELNELNDLDNSDKLSKFMSIFNMLKNELVLLKKDIIKLEREMNKINFVSS